MIKINKMILTVLLFTLVFPIISHGENFDFELNANSTDVEGKLNVQLPVYGTYLNVGAGAIFSDNDDDYWVSNVSAALKDEVLLEALTLGLGFKGLTGQADVHNEDFNIRSLSFLALGEYDFRKTNIRLPISLSLSYAMSPTPLNFSDTKKYQEFISTVYVHIGNNAAAVVGYRNIDVRFDYDSGEAKHSDGAFFFGIKLLF